MNYNKFKKVLSENTDTEIKLLMLMYFYNLEDETKYYPVLNSNIKCLANTLGTTQHDIRNSINTLIKSNYIMKSMDKLGIKYYYLPQNFN